MMNSANSILLLGTGDYALIVIAIAAVLGFGYVIWKRRQEKKNKIESVVNRCFALVRAGGARQTSAGADVWHEASLTPQTSWFAAIDAGHTETFHRAECLGYAKIGEAKLHGSDYGVCILKSEVTPNGNDAFRVPAGQYAGHPKYDPENKGWIYAAEMVIAFDGMSNSPTGKPLLYEGAVYALPAPSKTDLTAFRQGAQFAPEHIIYRRYDPKTYKETETHQKGGHPIMPPCTAGFKSEQVREALHIQIPTGETVCVLPTV